MRIGAIDPGTRESALVVWDGAVVREQCILPNAELLALCRTGIWCDLLVVEQVESYGMAVGREVFETVWWAGRFVEAAENRGGKSRMVPRRVVKLHLCQSMRAKDGNIRQALIDRFGPPGSKNHQGPLYGISSHKWAALALAVTVLDETRSQVAA